MAGIKKLTTGRYEAWYRDPANKEKIKRFARKGEAQKWLDEQTASLVRSDWIEPRRGKLTVGEWSDRWLRTKVNLKPSTYATYASILKTKVKPRWEHVPLARVDNEDVAAWIADLSASGLSASRVRQTHTVFSAMLDAAVRAKRLATNPANVDLPRLPARSHTYLTHEQVATLADACGDYRALVFVLAYGGLRFGEAAALRVRHVDVLRSRLTVTESMTEVNGRAIFSDTKTHAARSVPLPAFVRELLAVELGGKGPDDLVFTSPRGDVLRMNNFRRHTFDRAAAAVGLDGLTPHSLRHTAASLAISAGAHVKSVQSLLGHASAAVTLDVYAGLFGDDLDAVAERLNAAADFSRTSRGPEVVALPARRARKGA